VLVPSRYGVRQCGLPASRRGDVLMGAGRPTDYRPEYAEQAKALATLGATDPELADFFKVAVSTISRWKVTQPQFSEALKQGKDAADERVEASLYHRALGYSHPDVDIRVVDGQIVKTDLIKHYPPDTTAAIFWLKNRRRAEWRDKVDHEVTGKDGGPVEVVDASPRDIAKAAFMLLQEATKAPD
jgi:hypothetical protein